MAADRKSISLTEFTDLMRFSFGDDFPADESLAVGVSGGPDSMALCFLLSLWAQKAKRKALIHALTVDHGLRTDSDAEAKQVGRWLKGFKSVRHKILTWRPDKAVTSRVQERAREARYELMASFMKKQGTTRLFLAHHLDDQAETVLFRLSRGTGLDGLSGMAAEQAFADGLVLCRPLLSIPKERLVQTCEANGVKYIDDPSNRSAQFARVRMRGSMDILEAEGLTAERLGVTAKRLGRARKALDQFAEGAFYRGVLSKETSRIVFSLRVLHDVPEEIGLRVLLRMISTLCPPDPYGPRLERVEGLFCDLMKPESFRKRTLHGIVFERMDREWVLRLGLEDSGKLETRAKTKAKAKKSRKK